MSRHQFGDVNRWPVALSVSGLDGSGGAGFHADLRTFERCGVYGVGVLTAVVAQSPGSVSRVDSFEPSLVRSQFRELAASFPIAAAKTGVLASSGIVKEVADFFTENPGIPLVIDPVMRATADDKVLTDQSAFSLMASLLFRRATLITPNLNEAEVLLGKKIRNLEEVAAAARQLGDDFGTAVLLKGGHLETGLGRISDCYYQEGRTEWMSGPKLEVPDLHGTGCVLSALITGRLARGFELRQAILFGREKLREWMTGFYQWQMNDKTTFSLNSGCNMD